MSEFSEMMKEAFLGLEKFDSLPGKADLQKSIEKFDHRERTLRHLAWFAVTLMTALLVGVLVSWLRAGDDTTIRFQMAHLALFLLALTSIGMMKLWLIIMQYHFTSLKEMKRTQRMLLEAGEPAGR